MQVDHYLQQGVEHFFLIDDGSTDHSHAVLRPYIHQGLVTMMVDVRKDHVPPISMVERYNMLLKPYLYLTTWVLHVDLDEFVYGRHASLAHFLAQASPDVGEIRVPWKLFGSSGHMSKPTGGFVQNFVRRRLFEVNTTMVVHTKPIFRAAALQNEEVHFVHLKPDFYSGFALKDGSVGPIMHSYPSTPRTKAEWLLLTDEQILDDLEIHCNHYALRWKDWFMAVKATRGIADREISVYDEQYFIEMDVNDIIDEELAKMSVGAIE